MLSRACRLLAWIPTAIAGVFLWQPAGPLATGQGAPAATVRFHHVHYRVADPAGSMNEAARRTGGARVIVSGLGVGVNAGGQYLLFDRGDAPDPEREQRPLREAYADALRWLVDRGVRVEPPTLTESPLAASLPDAQYDHIAFATTDLSALAERLPRGGDTVLRRTADAVLFEAGTLRIEIVRDQDREDAFWCPMHPDVRSPDEGTCPACGMNLVPIPPPRIGEYRIDVTQRRDARQSVTGLDLSVREPGTGALVTRYAVVHERIFHLFIVSRDLRYFAHVHPEQQPDGRFRLDQALPAGEYVVIADFLPEGGTSQMVQKAIIVSGRSRPLPAADESNGLRVRMSSEELAAGRHARLTFTVEDAASGDPVSDLQPYLGAPAHLLIVRSDLSDAVHGHPEELATGGPTVTFHPIIPAAGAYRIWIQFQRAGRVSTHAFDLVVDR